MTKYQYTGPAADYPTLGFSVSGTGAIVDGTMSTPTLAAPPDARWAVYGGGSAESGIARYGSSAGATPTVEPTDGFVLAYSDADNAYVPTDLTATFVTHEQLEAALADFEGGGGGEPLPAIEPYPLALTTANPNLFAGTTLPTNYTGGFVVVGKNLDPDGPRHVRMAWTYHLAVGTSAVIAVREFSGPDATGSELPAHELNYDPEHAVVGAPYKGVFEFTAHPDAQSMALIYRSNEGTTQVTLTEFDMRQVDERSDFIVTRLDPKTTGSIGGSWILDLPAPAPAGATPTTWRGRTFISYAAALEMAVQSTALFVDDDTYENTGHLGYRGEGNFDKLGTEYGMNLGNNDFIIGVRVPSDIDLEPEEAGGLFGMADGNQYLLRGNVHGGEKGRTGDVNADFEVYVDRLGNGTWARVTGPAVLRRCRAVKFVARTKVFDANTPTRIEIDKTYVFYPDGTFRQDREMRFVVDTYWADFFVNMSSYDPAVALVGKIGQGQQTLGSVDYHGVGSDVQDDLAIIEPGGWGVYLHPTAPVCQGQGVDPEQLLAHSRITGAQLAAVRFQDGGGSKFYQRIYADPDVAAGHPPFDGNDEVGTGANFFPAGTVLTTRHWGVLYQPADDVYLETEAKAIVGRVPQISVRYPAI